MLLWPTHPAGQARSSSLCRASGTLLRLIVCQQSVQRVAEGSRVDIARPENMLAAVHMIMMAFATNASLDID